MALKLDLQKSAQTLRLSLEKAGVITPPSLEVAFNLDVSGSYEDEHKNGQTTDLITRLVPWGLVFDPDKKLDMFTFSDGRTHVHYVGEVTADNCENYVHRNIIRKVPGWNGGTTYADVLRRDLEHFGWIAPQAAESPKRSGFFSRLLSGDSETTGQQAVAVKRKSLILFNTDGHNSDKRETQQFLEEMEQRGDQVYVQFIAYSNDGKEFPFLQELADRFPNTGLEIISNMKKWVEQGDEAINERLITPELITWLKQ